jgi:polyisoprenoid-binding protein YceI
MKKFLTLITCCLFATMALAQQKLIPAQSDISFSIKQMGVPIDGKFTKFDAQVAFDPKKPETGKIAFTIDLNSAVVGDAETIKELKKPEWFSIIKFPSATFTSTSIKATGPTKFDVMGNLSIKGVVKPVVVPVTLTKSGVVTVADGSFAIKRGDFKIGEGDWSDFSIVANDVQVKFKLGLSGL